MELVVEDPVVAYQGKDKKNLQDSLMGATLYMVLDLDNQVQYKKMNLLEEYNYLMFLQLMMKQCS
jgi:hypothetical protein